MKPVVLRVQIEGIGELPVIRASGTEGMNQLSRWTVTAFSSDGEIALDTTVGKSASIALEDTLEGFVRTISLIVTDVAYEGESRNGSIYTLGLAPQEWLLTQRAGYRVLQDKTVPEIVKGVLADAGIALANVVFRLSGSYPGRHYCVQYSETEWGFIERLLADEGIAFWFETIDGAGAIVFGDALTSHNGIESSVVVPFADPSQMTRLRSFHELEVISEISTQSTHVRAYDVRHPDVWIEGRAGQGDLDYFEYPATVASTAAAKQRAQVRLEQLQKWTKHALGASDCVRIQPGRITEIEGCADDALNAKYLVVSVQHQYSAGVAYHGATAEDPRYGNHSRLVLAEKATHRPDLPRPLRVEGLEPAVTSGPQGEEIHVNDLGEVKLTYVLGSLRHHRR